MQILLTGVTGAAIVKLLDNLLQWRLDRKAKREDTKQKDTEQWREDTDRKINALVDGQKSILLDRIQYLGRAYLWEGEIDFNDRRRLHMMHTSYHNLNGNGDLDTLMSDVDDLPLKE